MIKDKKLLFCAVLLPITVLFSGYALAAGLKTVPADGAPPVAQSAHGETCLGVPIELTLNATDEDNDIALYQLTEQPRLGTAQIDGAVLRYTPGKKAGTDKFSYTAVDENGNTAPAATVTVTVVKNRSKLTYADMEGNPSHYAAICLSEAGVMTGEKIGDCSFFHPTQPITRSEFITMASAVADLPLEPTEQTDFADDGGLSPWAKPYVSAAASSGLVSGYRTAGGYAEIRGQNPITLAEACVVVNNLLTETLQGAEAAYASEHSTEMDWAQSAIGSLNRLQVLSPLSEMQQPSDAISRQTACELLYNAMQLMEE